jgi:hypothetical protein
MITNDQEPLNLNMRKEPRKGVDMLIFNNPDYLIYRKNADKDALVSFPADLLFIGARSLANTRLLFVDNEAWTAFLEEVQRMTNSLIEEVRTATNGTKTVDMPKKKTIPNKRSRRKSGDDKAV